MGSHRRAAIVVLLLAMLHASRSLGQPIPPVHTVLFTHIEDTTPGGALGSAQSRNQYALYRNALIAMGNMAQAQQFPWTLQPDWKFLEAALLYEDAVLMANTDGKNCLRYLKENLGVRIDAHSHESGGYNYTDVAHLLDSLGVGGTTVIGGHVWDPGLPQFAEWDRFRVPVAGQKYPGASWRGDILMGSGTPNHVNDPVVSGVWRPRDRDHYFEDDQGANIAAIGQYKGTLEGITELRDLYRTAQVPLNAMLTASFPARPATLIASGGLDSLLDSLITPLLAMRDSGAVVPTDFTQLIETWRTSFGSLGYLYYLPPVVAVVPVPGAGLSLSPCVPNPVSREALLYFMVSRPSRIHMAIFDVHGRERAVLVDDARQPGRYAVRWAVSGLASGMYFCRIREVPNHGRAGAAVTTRLVIAR